jgi:hypothetical protein
MQCLIISLLGNSMKMTQVKTSQPSMKMSKVAPVEVKALTAIEEFTKSLGVSEGVVHHEDGKGLKTTPYGLVIDKAKHPSAYKRNKSVADSLGIVLDKNITPENSLKVASGVAKEDSAILRKALPSYKDISAKAQSIVIDARYNTSVNYGKLTTALKNYEVTGEEKYRKEIVLESRRMWTPEGKTEKEYNKGLDNRVAKLLHAKGYIKSLEEAKEFGLALANTDEIPAK